MISKEQLIALGCLIIDTDTDSDRESNANDSPTPTPNLNLVSMMHIMSLHRSIIVIPNLNYHTVWMVILGSEIHTY